MTRTYTILEDPQECSSLIHGSGDTEFGTLFLVFDDNENIYYASFPESNKIQSELANAKKLWPKATFSENLEKVGDIIKKIFNGDDEMKLKLTGTPFQVSVWKAIVNIKEGSTASYEDVAKAIGNPKAVRAVATAVQKNKLAYLVPCHRVISKTGGISKYKWGSHRKIKLLTHEKVDF